MMAGSQFPGHVSSLSIWATKASMAMASFLINLSFSLPFVLFLLLDSLEWLMTPSAFFLFFEAATSDSSSPDLLLVLHPNLQSDAKSSSGFRWGTASPTLLPGPAL